MGRTGNLRRSMALIENREAISIPRSPRGTVLILGFRRGDAAGTNGMRSGYHSHLILDGTNVRRHRSGKSTGRLLPNPFLNTPLRVGIRDFPRLAVRSLERGISRLRGRAA